WTVSTLCSSRSSRMLDPASVVAWVMVVGLVITLPVVLVEGVPGSLHGGSAAWLVASGAGNVGGLVLAYGAYRVGQIALTAPLVSTEGAIAALIALAAGETIAPGVGVTLAVIVVGVCLAAAPAADEPRSAGRARPSAAVVLA